MKNSLMVLCCLFCARLAAQGEFKTYSNGLIYDSVTMKKLASIVDAQNVKFKQCDFRKKYYSVYQARAHYFSLEKNRIKEAIADMNKNVTFEDFLAKYENARFDKDNVIIAYNDNENKYAYRSLTFKDNTEHEINTSDTTLHHMKEGKWIFVYAGKSAYSSESVSGFYLTEDFSSKPVSPAVQEMIQYSECMIDTNSRIYLVDRDDDRFEDAKKKPAEIKRFMDYVDKETKGIVYPASDRENDYYYKDSVKDDYIDKNLSKTEKFKSLLKEAVEYAMAAKVASADLEYYAGKYYSRESELFLMRCRIVMGMCSQDASPRYHAFNIARLSAETANWEVFLRAHLDIMNDRFSRMTDGSYAWAGRQTYLKELEELNINTTDLLLGISFRIENPSKNHYFSNVGRIGRALAEASNKDQVATRILNNIKDTQLDLYNRIIMYYLFQSFNYYMEDSAEAMKGKKELDAAIHTLPDYVYRRMTNDAFEFDQLLYREIDTIRKVFYVTEPTVNYGGMSSVNWDIELGSYWKALLMDKSSHQNVFFETIMSIDGKVGSIYPLLKQKDKLLDKVSKVGFLNDILKSDSTYRLEICFTNNTSFNSIAQHNFLEDIPEALKKDFSTNLEDVVFCCLTNGRNWSRWLLFPDGKIMLWHIDGISPLKKYTTAELRLKENDLFNAYKLFDPAGNILNK